MAVRFTFDLDKTVAAITFIASRGMHGITKYRICKLIFLADKYHLVRSGRSITGDRICAMEYGPVPSQTLNLLNAFLNGADQPGVNALAANITLNRTYQHPHFEGKEIDFEEFLSPSDIAALTGTIEDFGGKSFEELKALTHEMAAYRKAREGRTNESPSMKYEDLFEEDDEAIDGALDEMLENHQLRDAFGHDAIQPACN